MSWIPKRDSWWMDEPSGVSLHRLYTVERKLVHKSDGWHVYSEDGSKHLGGPYKSKAGAEKRLKQVEYFKNK